jgi:methylated-DNA-[protein]-cysteine S-methyltransferase
MVPENFIEAASRQSGSRADHYQATLATPFCVLGIRAEDAFIAEIVFLPKRQRERAPQNRLAERACRQVLRYIDDPQFRFDLPLKCAGSPFQRRVWACIASIPSGRTLTYGEIATRLGSAPRAVGQACGANPHPVIIPCHRVVAAGGLGGFAHRDAGFLLSVKRWLLQHEAPRA